MTMWKVVLTCYNGPGKGPVSTEKVQLLWEGSASVTPHLPGRAVGTSLFFPLLLFHFLFSVTFLAHMVLELTQPRDSGPETF